MAAEVKHYSTNKDALEKYDAIVRKAAKDAGEVVIAELDKRFTEREGTDKKAGWSAYMRFLCDSGKTIFLSLKTMTAIVSDKANPVSVRKHKALLQRQAERAERKAKREAKAVAASKKPKTVKVKRQPISEKVVKAATAKVVPYDPGLDVLEAMGQTTSSKKHNARKTPTCNSALPDDLATFR